MKYIKSFAEFVNESYSLGGNLPESITFDKFTYELEKNADKKFDLIIGQKTYSLNFYNFYTDDEMARWAKAKKELNQKKFETDLIISEEIEFGHRRLFLDGLYTISTSKDYKDKIVLTQKSKSFELKVILPEAILLNGKIK